MGSPPLGAIVLGERPAPDGVAARPLGARVRADGPLLPALALSLAREIAAHYLAPPALVIRAMLPPGLLEKLELVATPTRRVHADDPSRIASRNREPGSCPRRPAPGVGRGPRAARDLPAPDGRARAAAPPAGARDGRPRGARVDPAVARRGTPATSGSSGSPTPAGMRRGGGREAPGRPLGRAAPAGAPRRARRAGAGRSGGRRRPELARAPRRGGRRRACRGAAWCVLDDARGASARSARDASTGGPARRSAGGLGPDRGPGRGSAPGPHGDDGARRDAAPRRRAYGLGSDGRLRGGHRRDRWQPAARPWCSSRRSPLALPLVDRLRGDLAGRVAVLHSGLGEGERADEWRRIRAGDRRRRRRDPDWRSWRRSQDVGARDRRRGARRGLQERSDAAVPGARSRRDARSPGRRGGGPRQRDAVRRDVWTARAAHVSPRDLARAPGRGGAGRGRSSTCVRSSPPATAVCSPRPGRRPARRSTRARRPGDPVINRRGTASVVLCRDCGHVQACPDCDPAARLPPGRHDASLPPLRTRRPPWPRAARPAASPRIRYLGGGTERRGARGPRPASPACASARLDRDVVERRGAAERVLDAFAAGGSTSWSGRAWSTKGLDIAGGHAGRRRLGRHRAQPPRRAGRRADVPAARPGGRPGRPRASGPGERVHPDLPARAPGDPGGRGGRRGRLLRRGAGARASGSGRRRSAARSS